MSTAHIRIKVDGSVVTLSIKNSPIGLHVMYLYFPDTVILSYSICSYVL
jgi:hypothetical protein